VVLAAPQLSKDGYCGTLWKVDRHPHFGRVTTQEGVRLAFLRKRRRGMGGSHTLSLDEAVQALTDRSVLWLQGGGKFQVVAGVVVPTIDAGIAGKCA
jgi:hypothetical protein